MRSVKPTTNCRWLYAVCYNKSFVISICKYLTETIFFKKNPDFEDETIDPALYLSAYSSLLAIDILT